MHRHQASTVKPKRRGQRGERAEDGETRFKVGTGQSAARLTVSCAIVVKLL